jgi:hypothetical protein
MIHTINLFSIVNYITIIIIYELFYIFDVKIKKN